MQVALQAMDATLKKNIKNHSSFGFTPDMHWVTRVRLHCSLKIHSNPIHLLLGSLFTAIGHVSKIVCLRDLNKGHLSRQTFLFSAQEDHIFRNCVECQNHTYVQCIDFRHNTPAGRKAFFVYTTCISFFVPMLIIILCYIVIMINLAKMAKRAEGEICVS